MLLNNIDTLKSFIPTIATSEFSRYERSLELAEEWMARELTGTALLEDLDTDIDEVLIVKLQDVVAHRGYLAAIPKLDLVETENGFAVASNTNLAPASTARVNALKDGLNDDLTDRIESLLQYLEVSEQYHTVWKTSKAYTLVYDSYIFNLTDFRRFAPFAGNRLAFIAAKPSMQLAIKLNIEPVISPELSEEIIEQLRDDDLSIDNSNIIDNIRYAFAFFTIGDEKVGTSFLNRVRKTIMKDVDLYPAFKASDVYAQFLAQKTLSCDSPFLACGI